MTSRLLIAGVAAGCVTAAGVGGYLAVRTASHPAEPTVAAAAATQTTPPPVAAPAVASSAAPDMAAAPVRPTASRVRPASPASRPAPVVETPVREALPAEPAPAATADLSRMPPPDLDVPTAADVIPMHPGRSIELPAPRYELVELPANAVIGIRLDTTVSTESARVEDAVRARVTRPVIVDGVTVIPTGTRLNGLVTEVETGGRFRERARIGVRFTSLTLDDNRHVSIQTETIYREGDPPAGEATAKIGASAVVGTILGGVIGGRKGAAIGAATGAAGGTAVVAAGGPNAAVLPSGSVFTLRLSEPATIQIDR